ncbi:MAG: DUF4347 domain-containing protein, partial [Spiribacter salinus]
MNAEPTDEPSDVEPVSEADAETEPAPESEQDAEPELDPESELDPELADESSEVEAKAAGERVLIVSGYLPNLPEMHAVLGDVARIHVLEGNGDALGEISSILAGYDEVAELHVVTHGKPGALVVGDEVIDHTALKERTGELSGWQDAYRSGSDILLYGCDIGAGQTGRVFVEELSAQSGADIAASNDTTAPEAEGGDSDLEVEVGTVTSAPLLTADILAELDWVLDGTAPTVEAVNLEVGADSVKVTLATSEPIAGGSAESDTSLYLNVGGQDFNASYIGAESTSTELVYAVTGLSNGLVEKGVRLGELDYEDDELEDAAGNDLLIAPDLNGLLEGITVADGATLRYGGGLGGDQQLTKGGDGELILTGENTHSGQTIVEGGTLRVSHDNQLGNTDTGADRVVVKNGATLFIDETLTLNQNRGIKLESGAAIAVADGKTVSYNGKIIGDSGPAIKAGAGELKLTNPGNFSEGVKVDEGRLTVTHGSGLDNAASVEVSAGAVLDLTGNNQTIAGLTGAGTVEIATRILTVTRSDGGSTTFAGDIVGTSGQLSVEGNGTLTLAGSADYTGRTGIKDTATLQLGADQVLNPASQVHLFDSGTFDVNGHRQIVNELDSGNNTSTVDLGQSGNAGHLEIGASNSGKSVYSQFTGHGELVKRGTGTLSLYAANDHVGRTFVAEGQIRVVGDSARLSENADVLISDVGKLDMYTAGAQTIGTIAGAGELVLSASDLGFGGSADTRFSGTLNTSRGGELIKKGTGEFTPGGGDDNNNNSVLRVSEGTVVLDKQAADAERLATGDGNNSLALIIEDGATVKLAGSDSLDADDDVSQVYQYSNIQIDAGGTL